MNLSTGAGARSAVTQELPTYTGLGRTRLAYADVTRVWATQCSGADVSRLGVSSY
jgi:hypothetical protein